MAEPSIWDCWLTRYDGSLVGTRHERAETAFAARAAASVRLGVSSQDIRVRPCSGERCIIHTLFCCGYGENLGPVP